MTQDSIRLSRLVTRVLRKGKLRLRVARQLSRLRTGAKKVRTVSVRWREIRFPPKRCICP